MMNICKCCKGFVALVFFAIMGTVSFAQEDACPAIVQTALANVDSLCEETGRNQACYGNLTLTAEARESVEALTFKTPGDIANVADIQSLALSPMDEAAGEWGISLMSLQANLPDTLPGQNVTLLLFGDVAIKPVPATPTLTVSVASDGEVNMRSEPLTTGDIIAKVAGGTTLTANGRNEYNDWLRVQLDDGQQGWINYFLLKVDGDINILDEGWGEDETPVYRPMQAFYFRSGIGESPCQQAPQSGILIQTPQGVGVINLTINEVDVALSSTVYAWAEPGDAMTIAVLEGHIEVEAFGERVNVPAGAQISVPVDDDLAASGPPLDAVPYDPALMNALPVNVLPAETAAVAPLSVEVLEAQSSCTVTANSVVKLREGPGTNYATVGSLAAGETVAAVAQGEGRDNQVWQRLENGLWVRADVVQGADNCASIRVITERPPLPTIDPLGNNNDVVTFNMRTPCQPLYPPLLVGDSISLRLGYGFSMEAERDAAAATENATITVNGQSLATTIQFRPCGEDHNSCYEVHATWQPTAPGDYQVVAVNRYGIVYACNLTVNP